MKSTPYPVPSSERRDIIRELSEICRALDDEADERTRPPRVGSWNEVVRVEIMRAAGTLRLVATLIVNGSYSDRVARFWIVAARDYLALVERTNERGVIA